jgi:hypothetical protein
MLAADQRAQLYTAIESAIDRRGGDSKSSTSRWRSSPVAREPRVNTLSQARHELETVDTRKVSVAIVSKLYFPTRAARLAARSSSACY